ncbi:MAG: hypothetical protein IPH18_15445 [Chitinophagaceae bacterium]|nr:hypothetical protein [Chitinophagaceae bacterium]
MLWLLPAVLMISACGKKKKVSLSGDEKIEISDFIAFFQKEVPPFQVADSIFKKKDKDSLLISSKVFSQFVPDSVLTKVFGKGVKPKIFAVAGVKEPDAGTYLFVKAITPEKRALLILAFDKKINLLPH